MDKYLFSTASQLAKAKLEVLIESFSKDRSDFAASQGTVLTGIRKFFERLFQPLTEAFILNRTTPRSDTQFSEFFDSVDSDLAIVKEEALRLTRVAADAHNEIVAVNESLRNRANRLISKSKMLSLLTTVGGPMVFVAGDSFTDGSKLLTSSCDLVMNGGISLKKSGSNNLSTGNIQVSSNAPNAYEGRFYARLTDVVPEGGSFHWETKMFVKVRVNTPITTTVFGTPTIANILGNFPLYSSTATTTGYIERLEPMDPDRDYTGVSAENIIAKVTDVGASDSEKLSFRSAMVDNDPTTLWQIESTSLIPVQDVATLDQYRSYVRSLDFTDLIVVLTMDLEGIRTINWINLITENFGEESWIVVSEVSHSTTGDTFEVLSNENVESWQFAPINTRYVRIVIKQTLPVPAPYQVYRFLLTRNVSTTVVSTKTHGLIV